MSDSNSGTAPHKSLGVFAVIEKKDPGKPAHWLKIGNAFTNRDGSLSLYLDAFPISTNKLQVREARPWDDQRPGTNRVAADAEAES